MLSTILAILVILFVIFGAIFSLKQYDPTIDFDNWCIEVKLHLQIHEIEEFTPKDWINFWYEGKAPTEAIDIKYKIQTNETN